MPSILDSYLRMGESDREICSNRGNFGWWIPYQRL